MELCQIKKELYLPTLLIWRMNGNLNTTLNVISLIKKWLNFGLKLLNGPIKFAEIIIY